MRNPTAPKGGDLSIVQSVEGWPMIEQGLRVAKGGCAIVSALESACTIPRTSSFRQFL